jgi:hypothetical protein
MSPRQAARILVGFVLFVLIILLIKFGELLLLVFVGVLYPAFEFIQLRNKTDILNKEKEKWLAYWVVYGLYNGLLRVPLRKLLAGFPFVFMLEVGFYIWLYHPKTEGAELIHRVGLDVFIKKHGKVIEENIKNVKKAMDSKSN